MRQELVQAALERIALPQLLSFPSFESFKAYSGLSGLFDWTIFTKRQRLPVVDKSYFDCTNCPRERLNLQPPSVRLVPRKLRQDHILHRFTKSEYSVASIIHPCLGREISLLIW